MNNHYVQKYRIAHERLHASDVPDVAIQFSGDEGGPHGTRYSGPTASEVAAIIVGDLATDCNRFDVVAEAISGQLEYISYLNPSLMPLQYPLLFPYGDKSFHLDIEYQKGSAVRSSRRWSRKVQYAPSLSSNQACSSSSRGPSRPSSTCNEHQGHAS